MNLFVGAKDEALLSNITTVENKKKEKKREKNKRNSPRFHLIDNVFWLGDFIIFAMRKAERKVSCTLLTKPKLTRNITIEH